jgi:hypothetical protein
MTIDLLSLPPKCTHCVLGKQTRSPVSKVWESPKASHPLECIYVDLCGPMPSSSCSRHLYLINLINNFSSYIWSLPLRNKAEAAIALQHWHKHVITQFDRPLKILVTDNGELVSNSISFWCLANSINHLVTALYMSAQNGYAECVYQMIHRKARAMHLACNMPPSLWDKFCITAAYLTKLTAMPMLGSKTPYKLWYGWCPSLSHLRKIRCCAFALIQTNNPKIYHRSMPYILIGYMLSSKAYCL